MEGLPLLTFLRAYNLSQRLSYRHIHQLHNILNRHLSSAADQEQTLILKVKDDSAAISPSTKTEEVKDKPVQSEVMQSTVAPPSGGYDYFKTIVKIQTPNQKEQDLLKNINRSCDDRQILPSDDHEIITDMSSLDHPHLPTVQQYEGTHPDGVLTTIVKHDRFLNSVKTEKDLVHLVKKRLQLKRVKPVVPEASYNLAAYVQESETLQKLVSMGVDLSKVEKEPEAAEHLLKADWETAIQPYLNVMHDTGVSLEGFPDVIGKFPSLFLEDLHNLKIRLSYLESKNFSPDSISRIVTKSPRVLGFTTEELDAKLGFLQREFKLKGDEVRKIVTANPKVVLFHNIQTQEKRLTLKDMMGFSDQEIKQMILAKPRLILAGKRAVLERFDYLHNTMKISHKALVSWPSVFITRLFIIKQRHLFLESIERAQYDPTKENYVSLKSLVSGRDIEFCDNVAKVPLQQFRDFLKTV